VTKFAGDTVTVDICIATYKRPEALEILLRALQKQELKTIQLRVIVIDNDRARSAEPVVEKFLQSRQFDLLYDVEPEQNIALARNRGLANSQSSYIAFIDDDEFPVATWLQSLLHCLTTYRADIVFGPVFKTLPDDAPSWASACFQTARRPTGEKVSFGGAGNALMARHVLAGNGMWFNPAFGLTGGEDTDFFYRQYLAGRLLTWCDEAIVTEPVSPGRLTLRWVWLRGFRGGQIFNRVFVSRYSPARKVLWFVTKIAQLVIGAILASLMRVVSYPSYIAMTVRLAAASGQLSRCFDERNFEEYSDQRPH